MSQTPEKFESQVSPETLKSPEQAEQKREVSAEMREAQDYQAAGILEEPKSGSFVSTLQMFVAWVKSQID